MEVCQPPKHLSEEEVAGSASICAELSHEQLSSEPALCCTGVASNRQRTSDASTKVRASFDTLQV